jgi:hypothetical protein
MGDLIHLISDLIKSDPDSTKSDPKFGRGLRERFNREPELVIKEYALTPEAQAALASMDKSEIICVIEQEFEDWQFPPNEFLAGACNTPGEQGLYPDPQPRVYEVAATTSGAQTTVTVTAQGLVRDATQFAVLKKGTAGPLIPSTPMLVTVAGTFRCGTFTAAVSGLTPGTFYVPVVQIGVPGHDTSILTMLDSVYFKA